MYVIMNHVTCKGTISFQVHHLCFLTIFVPTILETLDLSAEPHNRELLHLTDQNSFISKHALVWVFRLAFS
jgi:hypothetical protein